MTCPDCKSEEITRDSGSIFCAKCGLELDDSVIINKGYAHRSKAEKPVRVPKLSFSYKPKQELFALKIGLKNRKLTKDWEKNIGFGLKHGYLKPEMKAKALELIEKAYENRKTELEDAKQKITSPQSHFN